MRKRKFITALVVPVALAVSGIAGFGAQAASAAPGDSLGTVQLYASNYNNQGKKVVNSARLFNTQSNPASGSALSGRTVVGRVGFTTGLYYPRSSSQGGVANTNAIKIDVPVVAINGIPTYATSEASLSATCQTLPDGSTSRSVSLRSPVPHNVPSQPAPNYTIYMGGKRTPSDHELKVVYNEQSTLPDGRSQVVAKKVYFNVKNRGLLGSGPVSGSLSVGVLTCGVSK